MTLAEFIKSKRPNLSEGSIKTYTSILRRIYKKIFPEDDNLDTKRFMTDKKEVLEYLRNMTGNGRATILSALVVVTDKDSDYRDMMMVDIKRKEDETDKQELTDKQKDNWVTQEDITKALDAMRPEAMFLLKKKTDLANADLQRIQQFIILCLYGGTYIEPRRALDMTAMKIHGSINDKEDNYIDWRGKQFVYNKFKTVRSHGREHQNIPDELLRILKLWIVANPNEYLLIDKSNQGLTSVTLNQRINKLFPNKANVGVNGFRKSYLTNKFGDTISVNKELAKTMKAMGSSISVANSYIKDVN